MNKVKHPKKETFKVGDYIQDKRTKTVGEVLKVKKNITAQMPTTKLTQPIEHWEKPIIQ